MERVPQFLDIMDDYLGPALAFLSPVQMACILAAIAAIVAALIAGVPPLALLLLGVIALPAVQGFVLLARATRRVVLSRLAMLMPARSRAPANFAG